MIGRAAAICYNDLMMNTNTMIPRRALVREEATSPNISLSWFSCRSSILVELQFGVLIFVEGGELENPEKHPTSDQGENQQETQVIQPKYLTAGRNRTGASLVGSEHSQHCAILAPLELAIMRLPTFSNRPYSYSRCWTGTSLQWRLMRGSIIKTRQMSFAFEKDICLSCKLVPVEYREYKNGLFLRLEKLRVRDGLAWTVRET